MSVCFQNEGEIDLRGLLTFGASAKENENAIGYFGTGLKYAIAVLLREGCTIRVYIGMSPIEVHAQPTKIRNEDFDVVYLNKKEAAFTTDLGKNWKTWQAYRELFANCIDEKDPKVAAGLLPKKGYTTIVVSGEAIEKVHQEQAEDSIFLNSEPLFTLDELEIHPTPVQSRWIYYRGIRALKLDKPAYYNYNITGKATLTEDRTLSSLTDFFKIFARSISTCLLPSLIRQVLEADQRYFESTVDYNWWSVKPGECFNQIVAKYISAGTSFNTSAKTKYRNNHPDKQLPRPVQWEAIPLSNRRKIDAALKFWGKLGYAISRDMIVVTDGLEGKTRGRYIKGKIYLSERTLDEDMRLITGLIYKYWAQSKPRVDGVKEEDLLIDTIVDFGERLLGVAKEVV